jgi:hypothetical protein
MIRIESKRIGGLEMKTLQDRAPDLLVEIRKRASRDFSIGLLEKECFDQILEVAEQLESLVAQGYQEGE